MVQRHRYLQRERVKIRQRTLTAECACCELMCVQLFQEPVERKVEIPDVGTELLCRTSDCLLNAVVTGGHPE